MSLFNNKLLKIQKSMLDTDVQAEFNKVSVKADKTYVDTQVAAVASGSPKGVYTTLSALQTAFPTGNNNIYLVTADGKWYYWSGSAWTAGGTYQSTGIADRSVTLVKTDFLTPGKNLFNKNDAVSGYYFNAGDGNKYANVNMSYVEKIPVNGNTAYTFNLYNQVHIQYLDSNGTFISGVARDVNTPKTFTTPANCVYLTISVVTTDLSSVQLELGSAVTNYEDFELNLKSSTYTKPSDVQGITNSEIANYVVTSKNLFDKNAAVNGQYISMNDGIARTNSLFSYVKDIPILAVTAYAFNITNQLQIAFFDKNKTYISGTTLTAPTYSFTTPVGCAYLAISILTADLNTAQLEKGTGITSYEPYGFLLIGNRYAKKDELIGNVIHKRITVDPSGSGDFTTITAAVASILNASVDNQYDIYIKDGTYNEINITLPNYVNLIGESGDRKKCIVQGANLANASDQDITDKSTFNISGNNVFKNITATIKNGRYVIHSESNGVITDWIQKVENCYFEHLGNQEAIDYRTANSLSTSGVWSSTVAWSEGASDNAYAEFTNSEFIGMVGGWGVHGHDGATKPYLHVIEGCSIIAKNGGESLSISNGTAANYQKSKIVVKNSKINGSIKLQGTNPLDVTISGCGMKPVNVDTGYSFKEGHYPTFTDYCSEYINGSGGTLAEGVIVAISPYGTVVKATETTSLELIAGVTVGTAENGKLIKVVSNSYYTVPSLSTSVGTKYKVVNGALQVSGSQSDIIVGIAVDHYLIKMLA